MASFIKHLILPEGSLSPYKIINVDNDSVEGKALRNMSKINIFIGPNNSGKSRFLRYLSTVHLWKFYPDSPKIEKINNELVSLKAELQDHLKTRYGLDDYAKIFNEWGIEQLNNYIDTDTPYLAELSKNIRKILALDGYPESRGNSVSPETHKQIQSDLKEIVLKNKYLTELALEEPLQFNFVKTYIPTLRGFRVLQSGDDIYKIRTESDYFADINTDIQTKPDIFSGYTLYDSLQKLLLGEQGERALVKRFETFLSKELFEGEEVTLIPRIVDSEKRDVFVKIGDEPEKAIHDLGDGIQQIIILFFPMFRSQGHKQLVFIEEPDLFLHPGMQRKFIEAILRNNNFKNVQIFFTTHSNHFLDMTLDFQEISIFAFKKLKGDEKNSVPNFVIENVSNENETLLKLIGVSNSSVLITNCTIWVEGITDRYYLNHYLKLYEKYKDVDVKQTMKEDTHYSFVEYSGNNITHWSFLDEVDEPIEVKKLCGKLFLITDKDSEKKLERQRKLKKKLGSRYRCLPCKEVENLIKREVLLKVIADYEGVEDNKLNIRKFSEDSYRNIYLGEFIEKKLKTKARKGSYKSESGTISDKLIFCKKTIKYTQTFNDLTPDAQNLIKSLYSFIVRNNHFK